MSPFLNILFLLILPEFFFLSLVILIFLFNLNLASIKTGYFSPIFYYPNLLKINIFLLIQIILYTIFLYVNLLSYNFTLFWNSFISTSYLIYLKIYFLAFSIIIIYFIYLYCKKKLLVNFEFIYLFIISLIGLLLLLNSNDLLLLFVTLEVYNIAIYTAIGLRRTNFTLESAFKYLIYSSIITGIFLFSISLIYNSTGCTNYYSLELFNWYYVSNQYLYYLGFFLMIITLLMKIGLAPFHYWLVDIYDGAPMPITFFLIFLPKIIYFFIFIRLILFFIGDLYYIWVWIFLLFFLLSIIIGTFGALYQLKLKRIIIFSSISNSGFFLIPLIINNYYSLTFLFYFIIIYSFNLVGFFYILYLFQNYTNFRLFKNLINLNNLFYIQPIFSLAFLIFLFSLAGLPPLAGFFPKFYLILNLFVFDWFYLAVFTILLSSIAFFYYIRIVRIIMFNKKKTFVFLVPLSFVESFILSVIILLNLTFFFFSGNLIYFIHNYTLFLF